MNKILVIEDELAIAEIILAFLQDAGYEAHRAGDGMEGLEKFRKENYELILLDILLPKLSGYKVLENVRRESDIPVIMLTALDDEESQMKGFVLQADLDIAVPEIGNIPVVELEEQTLSDEMLKKLCNYFSKGQALYHPPAMTKAQLMEIHEKASNKEGNYGNPYQLGNLGGFLVELEQLIERAPEQEGDKQEVLPAFGEAWYWEKDLVSGKVPGEDLSEIHTGYSFLYHRSSVEELPGASTMNVTLYENLPETNYAPPFMQEYLIITVGEEGICRFEWGNPAKQIDIVAENVILLDFEKIKERLADHLLYAKAYVDEVNGFDSSQMWERYEVKNVELCMVYTNAYEHPGRAWLVPAWIFELQWHSNIQGRKELKREKIQCIIGAIDGGYISPY